MCTKAEASSVLNSLLSSRQGPGVRNEDTLCVLYISSHWRLKTYSPHRIFKEFRFWQEKKNHLFTVSSRKIWKYEGKLVGTIYLQVCGCKEHCILWCHCTALICAKALTILLLDILSHQCKWHSEKGKLYGSLIKNSFALMNSLNGSQGSPRLHGSHFENCCPRWYTGNLQVIQNSWIGSSPLFFFIVYISFLLSFTGFSWLDHK